MQENYNTQIPGWISERDLKILSTIASYVPENGNILEIGTFLGRSTSALFYSKKNSVNLSVVDTFEITDMYSTTLAQYDGDPEIFKQASQIAKDNNSWLSGFKYCVGEEAFNQIDVNISPSKNYKPNKKFDLVFVDGGHTIDNVVEDIVKFLKSDTLIIGDDFSPKYTSVSTALALVRQLEQRYMIVYENSKLWMLIPTNGYWKDFFKSQNVIQ